MRAGELWTCLFPYYDAVAGSMQFKIRPVLVIGKSDSGDYCVLPVSSVTNRYNVNADFDILITNTEYPLLGLSKPECFIRTHKQTTINRADFHKLICDVKTVYPELHKKVIAKLDAFHAVLMDQNR